MRDDSARHQWSLYFDTIGYVHPSTSCLKKLDIAMLGPFILGCLIGIISVAKLLQKVFHSYKQYLIPLTRYYFR